MFGSMRTRVAGPEWHRQPCNRDPALVCCTAGVMCILYRARGTAHYAVYIALVGQHIMHVLCISRSWDSTLCMCCVYSARRTAHYACAVYIALVGQHIIHVLCISRSWDSTLCMYCVYSARGTAHYACAVYIALVGQHITHVLNHTKTFPLRSDYIKIVILNVNIAN